MQALLQQVLADWREAERVAAESTPESLERAEAVLAAEQLKQLYADVQAAMTLGITDRGELAALFEEIRFRPTRPGTG